jgi:peptidoglycan L-alanyl-D-glutamate endopeptidase CwlK
LGDQRHGDQTVIDYAAALEVAKSLGFKVYDHHLGRGSMHQLRSTLPGLVQVARLAIQLCKYDGTVRDGGGLRTEAQAQSNVSAGTGILNSRHRLQPDGYSHAIDLLAMTGGGVDWDNLEAFRAMADAVSAASAILYVPIRQGCDWDMDGIFAEKNEHDWAHFENPKAGLLPSAQARMIAVRKKMGLPAYPEAPSSADCPCCGAALRLVSS